jgi:hypothetical protein
MKPIPNQNHTNQMKTFIPIIALTIATSWSAGTALHGQESATSSTVKSPPTDYHEAIAQVEQAQAEAQQMEAESRRQLARTFQQVAQMQEPPSAVTLEAGETLSRVGYDARRQKNSGSSGGSARALVIQSAETEPATRAALEEDLAVMSHIFDKVTAQKSGAADRERTAMGINVFFAPDLTPNRCLYLDGYGALFLLKVNFPLLAPPGAAREEAKEKPSTDSSWDQARRELYGQPGQPKAISEVEKFDPEKVNGLKDALLDSLKSATNIRNLKAEDSITVCVFGGAGQRVVGWSGSGNQPPFRSEYKILGAGGRGGSMLTIRVRKSDVDAYAKGRLDLEQFRKKVSVSTAQGNTDTWF